MKIYVLPWNVDICDTEATRQCHKMASVAINCSYSYIFGSGPERWQWNLPESRKVPYVHEPDTHCRPLHYTTHTEYPRLYEFSGQLD